MLRQLVALGAASVVGLSMASSASAGMGDVTATAGAVDVATATDEVTALRLAQESGFRVEVLRLKSETDQVFVNPDGTWTRETFPEPVRVRKGVSWVGVDSTLAVGADGTVQPAASPVNIRLSGGGSAPLLRVSKDGVETGVSWPSSLPAPTLAGDTATYPEVLPGVDLAVTVAGSAVSERLVVKTREAAQNPAVRALKFGMSATGGKVRPTEGGGFAVVDAKGRERFASPAPMMWDTAGTGEASAEPDHAPAPVSKSGARTSVSGAEPEGAGVVGESLYAPQEGDRTAEMDQSWSGSTMTVTPDADLLDSPSTVYPVLVDPAVAAVGISNWAMVDKTYPTTKYYNWSDQDQGVGYQDFSGVSTKRLFFGFNTSFLGGKTVSSATLSVYETYSATCAAGTVDAYLTNNVTSSTTWNSQPGRSTGVLGSITTKAGRSDCRSGGYLAEIQVGSAVQTRATAKAPLTTFSLAGRSETTYSSWMRIGGPRNSTVSKRPKLSVTYNSTPNAPTTLSAPNTSTTCATTPTAPRIINPTSSNAFFSAFGGDPDGGTIDPYFYVWRHPDGLFMGWSSAGMKTGTSAAGVSYSAKMLPLTSAPSPLVNGVIYGYRTRISDNTVWGPYSAGYCYFKVDTSAPEVPTVTSETFQNNVLAPENTATGKFTFTAPDAAGFWYTLNGVEKAYLPTNATVNGMTAWTGNMSIPATTVGTLEVAAQDAAGNKGPKSAPFVFKKAVSGKLAEYLFNEPTTTTPTPATAADTATADLAGNPLVSGADAPRYVFDLTGDPTGWGVGRSAAQECLDSETGEWLCGDPQNRSRTFAGTGDGVMVSGERPFVSDRPFSVGGWVRLANDELPRTVAALNFEADPANPVAAPASMSVTFDPAISNGTLPDGQDAQPGRFVASLRGSDGVTYRAVDALPQTMPDAVGGDSIPVSRVKQWVYLVAIYDGTTLKLDAAHELVTGTSGVATVQVGPSTSVGASAAGLGAFRVGDGAVAADGSALSPWSGEIDNLSVWQQALSDTGADNQVLANVRDAR